MDAAAVTKSYARWAPIYDLTFGALTNLGRKRATQWINQKGERDILEVGVGTGLALPLYHRDKNVTGIDFSHDMLAKAREKVEEKQLPQVVALRQMDARALDFPDASFDTVAAMHILSVVPEPERVMAEIARVLRPGGHVVITNHFARERGVLAAVERFSAPFANLLGWHSDFQKRTVLQTPGLVLDEEESLPPLGMMTFLLLRKV
jgi:phosphatidylethanolamine/phosphatidyl-N-methylethanolamine N-methyltransferase